MLSFLNLEIHSHNQISKILLDHHSMLLHLYQSIFVMLLNIYQVQDEIHLLHLFHLFQLVLLLVPVFFVFLFFHHTMHVVFYVLVLLLDVDLKCLKHKQNEKFRNYVDPETFLNKEEFSTNKFTTKKTILVNECQL